MDRSRPLQSLKTVSWRRRKWESESWMDYSPKVSPNRTASAFWPKPIACRRGARHFGCAPTRRRLASSRQAKSFNEPGCGIGFQSCRDKSDRIGILSHRHFCAHFAKAPIQDGDHLVNLFGRRDERRPEGEPVRIEAA